MSDIIARLRHECELLRPESNWRQLTEEAVAEIQKLREALRQIRDQEPDRQAWSVGVARKALGEKE